MNFKILLFATLLLITPYVSAAINNQKLLDLHVETLVTRALKESEDKRICAEGDWRIYAKLSYLRLMTPPDCYFDARAALQVMRDKKPRIIYVKIENTD